MEPEKAIELIENTLNLKDSIGQEIDPIWEVALRKVLSLAKSAVNIKDLSVFRLCGKQVVVVTVQCSERDPKFVIEKMRLTGEALQLELGPDTKVLAIPEDIRIGALPEDEVRDILSRFVSSEAKQ